MEFLPREQLLTYEEIQRFVRIVAGWESIRCELPAANRSSEVMCPY